MNRLIISALFIFCLTGSLTAQTIYERTDTLSWLFSYTTYQRSTDNKVLNQLALAHLKIPEKTRLNYSFRYRTSINYSQNDSLYIFLDISTIEILGDSKIRDYDISSLLEPSDFKISYYLEHPDKGTIQKRKLTANMNNGIAMIGAFPDSLWTDGVKIRLTIDEINYSENDYRQLELELAAIRDYYASGLLADTLLGRIQKARKNLPELKEAGNIYMTGLKGLYLLNQSFDNSSLIVSSSDPLKNKGKHKILRYNFTEYTDYVLNKKSPLIIGNPYITLSRAYIESVVSTNRLSQQVDYYSSPFFYKLYSNTVITSQFAEAGRLLKKFSVTRGFGTPDTRILTSEILREYIEEGDNLLRQKRYAEAIDFLYGARKFMNFNPYGGVHQVIEDKLADARKGLIFSYTEIIQRSLDKSLYTLAGNYLVEVEKFIEKYGITNEESGPFREVYIRMADIHVQLGNKAINAGDYDKALVEFSTSLDFLNGYGGNLKDRAENGLNIAVRTLYNKQLAVAYELINRKDHQSAEAQLTKAIRFSEEFPSFYPDKAEIDSLKHQIAYLKYDQLLNSFPDNLAQANRNHIDKLIEARELKAKYNIDDTLRLDTLINKLGIPWVKSVFSKGNLKYWASQTDSALFYADYAFNTAKELGVDKSMEISQQYQKLTDLAGETYCNHAKGEFNSLLNQVTAYFGNNKYNEGLVLSERARELAYTRATCGITTAPVNNLLDRYKYPLRWNSMVNEAFMLLEQKRYRESADLIQKAEALFSYYRLDSLKIANVGYFELAIKSNDKDLVRHAIGYMLNKQEPDKALRLLDKLRADGMDALQCSDLQEAVARNLGTRDIKETPDLNVKVMIATYTRNDKWYSKFEGVYRYYTKSASQPLLNRTIDKITDEVKGIF